MGGFLDGLSLLGSIMMWFNGVLYGNPLTAYLIQVLYKKDLAKGGEFVDDDKASIDRINNRTRFIIKHACFEFLRNSKEKRLLEKGSSRTFKYLEIDRFIRTQK